MHLVGERDGRLQIGLRQRGAGVRDELVRSFRGFGFKFVTLDLEGFRSGSLNAVIPLEALQRPAPLPAGAPTSP